MTLNLSTHAKITRQWNSTTLTLTTASLDTTKQASNSWPLVFLNNFVQCYNIEQNCKSEVQITKFLICISYAQLIFNDVSVVILQHFNALLSQCLIILIG